MHVLAHRRVLLAETTYWRVRTIVTTAQGVVAELAAAALVAIATAGKKHASALTPHAIPPPLATATGARRRTTFAFDRSRSPSPSLTPQHKSSQPQTQDSSFNYNHARRATDTPLRLPLPLQLELHRGDSAESGYSSGLGSARAPSGQTLGMIKKQSVASKRSIRQARARSNAVFIQLRVLSSILSFKPLALLPVELADLAADILEGMRDVHHLSIAQHDLHQTLLMTLRSEAVESLSSAVQTNATSSIGESIDRCYG